jgi:molybdopterin-guanine dinucleotide biosynthesis adapter protein
VSVLPPIVSFVARSGTGKTTFLEGLIPALLDRGIRVMIIKHDVHGFEVDKPGKDTWRLRKAGARQVLIANAEQMALMGSVDGEQPLRSLIARYAGSVDLVLTEGYRRSGMPKVLVTRKDAPKPFAPGPEEIAGAFAIVADHDVALLPELPRLPLSDPGACADLLVERYVRPGAIQRPLTGLVLAGGRSARMGRDKAWLELDGRLILPDLVRRLATVCSGGVTVVRRDRDQELPDLPAGTRVVEDLLPENAALGGLYTGLALARTPFVFLTACDMPLVDPKLVAWLAALQPPTADVLLPIQEKRPQPMHAIYGHRCLGAIKEALLSGEFRMDGWQGLVRVERVEPERWRAICPDASSFAGANTPEELARAEQLAAAARAG